LVRLRRDAAVDLEKNGATTVSVFEALDHAEDLLNIVVAEETARIKRQQDEIERLIEKEGLSIDEALERLDYTACHRIVHNCQ